MPVRRTHGPHRASRGGPAGSEASGRPLLAVGEEARCCGSHARVAGRCQVARLGDARHVTQQRRGRAGRGTQIASVGLVGLVRKRQTVAPIQCASGRLVGAVHVAGQRVLNALRGHDARPVATRRRADHGSSQRTPHGEQHGKQHQQVDAQELHGRKTSRRGSTGWLQDAEKIVNVPSVARSSGKCPGSSPIHRPTVRP